MELTITIDGKSYSADLENPIDIAIAVTGAMPQLIAYGVPATRMEPLRAGNFIGSVAKGGSANCETVFFAPHCNGTHTESVGHIGEKPFTIREALQDTLMPATLATITPAPAATCGERYHPAPKIGDMMITRKALSSALQMRDPSLLKALIIRTTPNLESKKTMNYDREQPPFFSLEAMDYIVELGVDHLIVDMPSVDRLNDDGHLAAHHIYWGVSGGSHDLGDFPSMKTITELVYVPDRVKDGLYLLNLQVAAFESDAAPSRPVLFEIKPVKVV